MANSIDERLTAIRSSVSSITEKSLSLTDRFKNSNLANLPGMSEVGNLIEVPDIIKTLPYQSEGFQESELVTTALSSIQSGDTDININLESNKYYNGDSGFLIPIADIKSALGMNDGPNIPELSGYTLKTYEDAIYGSKTRVIGGDYQGNTHVITIPDNVYIGAPNGIDPLLYIKIDCKALINSPNQLAGVHVLPTYGNISFSGFSEEDTNFLNETVYYGLPNGEVGYAEKSYWIIGCRPSLINSNAPSISFSFLHTISSSYATTSYVVATFYYYTKNSGSIAGS